jgi:hypothetical protein
MQSFGLPGVSVLIVFAVGVGVPIWFALKAKPLATLPYKWATWLAIQTTLVSLVGFLTALSVITKKGLNAGAELFLLLGFLSLFGALGLFWRMRPGVPFLIASEVFLVLLNPLVDTLYPSGKPTKIPIVYWESELKGRKTRRLGLLPSAAIYG